jgi:hypothetical protein
VYFPAQLSYHSFTKNPIPGFYLDFSLAGGTIIIWI